MKKNKDVIIEIVEQEPKIELILYSIFFAIGRWRNLFSEQQTSVMIAEALNDCKYKHDMKITGYLISKRRLCLVLENDKESIDKLLIILYDTLRKELRKQYNRLREPGNGVHYNEVIFNTAQLLQPLFMQETLMNNCLAKLITGRPANLPYYDPHLERLKNFINKAGFCSAIDYSGAKGPVSVNLLKHQPGIRIRDVVFEK